MSAMMLAISVFAVLVFSFMVVSPLCFPSEEGRLIIFAHAIRLIVCSLPFLHHEQYCKFSWFWCFRQPF
jgi:hypothetical protein